MYQNFMFFMFLCLLQGRTWAKHITATRGGIVKPGEDLTLTLHVGSEWERCYWYFNGSYCSFDLKVLEENTEKPAENKEKAAEDTEKTEDKESTNTDVIHEHEMIH